MSRRLWAVPALLLRGIVLAACGDMGRFQTAALPLRRPRGQAEPTVATTPASEREHERILASYGGVYDDPKLEALVTRTVDRLVAASDRPDQAYKVTILNSGAVNAFALPTGQLYVTRGLIALANDTSELSSVLSHEMAHVLSKHAAMREDQARQAAIVDKRRHRDGQRPRDHRVHARQEQARHGEFFARAGDRRPTTWASASPRMRISIPMARRAS